MGYACARLAPVVGPDHQVDVVLGQCWLETRNALPKASSQNWEIRRQRGYLGRLRHGIGLACAQSLRKIGLGRSSGQIRSRCKQARDNMTDKIFFRRTGIVSCQKRLPTREAEGFPARRRVEAPQELDGGDFF